MKKELTKNITLSAMFLAIGFVLPYFTGQIKQIGNMLLPMHIPVLLCGLICGWKYGATVGLVLPLMRSMIFGMPVLFPNAVAMSLELMTYGLIIGIIYGFSKWKCIFSLYRALIIAMISGRIVWGIAQMFFLNIFNFTENTFTWKAFIGGAVLNAIPGIVIQLILIPAIMIALDKTGLVKFHKKKRAEIET